MGATGRAATKNCLFCGRAMPPKRAKDGKSDEHIVPQWLMDHLGIRDLPISPMRVDARTRKVLDLRHHTVGNFIAGRVCANCNMGWMSDLEKDTKPILIRLIADPHQLTALNQREQKTLARWAVKTAAVLNRASSHGNPADATARPVLDEHMKAVMSGGVPDGVAVLAGGCTSLKAFDFLQWAVWAAPKNSIPLRQKDRDRSYKIGVSFRDLLLAVAYYPATEYCYGVIEGQYIQLWGGRRKIVPIDHAIAGVPPDVSNSPILEGFLRNIFVVSDTWLTLIASVALTPLIR